MLELTGKRTLQVGLEGKFSVYRSAAVAIIHGRAGEEEYSDAQLEAKFRGLAEGRLGKPRSDALISLCRRVDSLADAGRAGPRRRACLRNRQRCVSAFSTATISGPRSFPRR